MTETKTRRFRRRFMRVFGRGPLVVACGLLFAAPMAVAQVSVHAGHSDAAPLSFAAADVGGLGSGKAAELDVPRGGGPFPAVIVLHACNGVSAHTRAWARRAASWGYAALIIDSFKPRRVENVCNDARRVPPALRARDAAAGAAYLRGLPFIDPARIGLVGFSHGASSALFLAPQAAGTDAWLKAIVAFYPACGSGTRPLGVDVLVLIGDADEWTPAQRCIDAAARRANDAAHKPELKVYPGATHAFDTRGPDRVYFGHRLAYDPAAAADAIAATRQFLDAHLHR